MSSRTSTPPPPAAMRLGWRSSSTSIRYRAGPNGDAGLRADVTGDIIAGAYARLGAPRTIPERDSAVSRWTCTSRSYTFQKGHRIMVQVQSTWFPLYDRNPRPSCPHLQARARDYKGRVHRSTTPPVPVERGDRRPGRDALARRGLVRSGQMGHARRRRLQPIRPPGPAAATQGSHEQAAAENGDVQPATRGTVAS